ncbi:MAG: hypothetical protein AB8G96_00130 [Phycisphaerales bacterium]
MMLKLAANVLVWGSLVLGTVSVSTAYLPPVEAVRAAADAAGSVGGEPLSLVAPAGRLADSDDPVLASGTVLTVDELDKLETSVEPVERLRVKQFSFRRWPELVWFLLAAVGLVGGAMLMRMETRRASRGDAAADAAGRTLTPDAALAAADEVLSDLLRSRGQSNEDARKHQILDQLDIVRQQHFEPFVGARPQLVDRLGMSGFAQVMDAFAGADRMLNRAWSAAADGYAAESEECLDHGLARLRTARERLDG